MMLVLKMKYGARAIVEGKLGKAKEWIFLQSMVLPISWFQVSEIILDFWSLEL